MKWPWTRKKPERALPSEVVADILDRLRGAERGVSRCEADAADLRADLQKRFGRIWKRLNAPGSDEPDEGRTEGTPPAPAETAHLSRRFRRF